MKTLSRPPIAIVEDDLAVQRAYADLFSSYDCETVVFPTAEEFLEHIADKQVACLILDQRLPGMNGLELQSLLQERNVAFKTVFITSQDDDNTKAKAIQAGAAAFFSKGSDVDDIIASVMHLAGYQID
ncbi:FixJ family two-component response regulator [Rhizobium azooxidifex]|uniref:FixJ family two-component response regulator n=1 Tax=Mycoplana azooxidifex TaxID=1636188 RepID=A0A7W6GLY9_9HYPH|nr:response regulator [Mycoplana azooxidifex]MBB3979713.1 FixJ family two-component response regulator [Mycoplana azooxidifex]